MGLSLDTAPEGELLTVEQVKAHLRIDFDDEDDYLAGLIAAATGLLDGANGHLGRALLTQEWVLTLPRFPRTGDIAIPLPPLVSVEAVQYYDCAGDLQTLAPQSYVVDTAAEPGRIALAISTRWPIAGNRPDAVTISFTAGFGDAADDVPMPIRQMALNLVGQMYAARGDVAPIDDVVRSEVNSSNYRVRTF
jgi:uncharacterized phiE125 gp8 family phage protein